MVEEYEGLMVTHPRAKPDLDGTRTQWEQCIKRLLRDGALDVVQFDGTQLARPRLQMALYDLAVRDPYGYDALLLTEQPRPYRGPLSAAGAALLLAISRRTILRRKARALKSLVSVLAQ